MSDPSATRWTAASSGVTGEQYAAQFARLAASGRHVHGEADFVADRAAPAASILDAGCGTGRVAIELSRRGHRCVGVDVDPRMLDVATAASSDVRWHRADLAHLDLPDRFDLVVAAGNVIPLLAPGTEAAAVAAMAGHLADGGLLVAGFGLDAAHLPLDDAPFGLDAYDRWCETAGLVLVERFATWDEDPFDPAAAGYAVTVHRRGGAPGAGASRDRG